MGAPLRWLNECAGGAGHALLKRKTTHHHHHSCRSDREPLHSCNSDGEPLLKKLQQLCETAATALANSCNSSTKQLCQTAATALPTARRGGTTG